ncbi:MAG TPA: serine/threonine-protein kinase [Kofleriaceae bacterium]
MGARQLDGAHGGGAMNCPSCGKEVLEIDVKCANCGHALGATGAQRMLGQVVLGQYELVDVLGQGGMSVVFKGKHRMTDQEVALKILPPELAAHSQVKSRFLEEAKALAALDHPNIVHLYNFGQENGLFVLAMQFVQGVTWERMILEKKALDWRQSVKITVDVLRALEYAHGRGVIHRDMKPSNVLVRAHDGMGTVMDFGIAKMTTSTKLTATGQTMGTVRYMSPEQVRGQEVDVRTDIYSLGATLYESLTGDTPFDGNTHFEIMTKHLSEPAKRPSLRGIEVPKLVEDALMRSLMKKIDDRFENAREMRKILEAALRENDVGLVDTQQISAESLRSTLPARPKVQPRAATPAGSLADQLEPGTTGASDAIRPRKKSRLPLFAALAVLLAGGAVGAVLLLKHGSGPPGFESQLGIQGVKLTAGSTFDGIRIETDGLLSPELVNKIYRRVVKGALGGQPAQTQLNEIVVIPANALCDPRSTAVPEIIQKQIGCSDGASPIEAIVITDRIKKRLVLVDDSDKFEAAVEMGVVDAHCTFTDGFKHGSPACDRLNQLQSPVKK